MLLDMSGHQHGFVPLFGVEQGDRLVPNSALQAIQRRWTRAANLGQTLRAPRSPCEPGTKHTAIDRRLMDILTGAAMLRSTARRGASGIMANMEDVQSARCKLKMGGLETLEIRRA